MQQYKQEMQGRQMRGTRQTTQKKNKNQNGVNQRVDYDAEPVINIQTITNTVERLTPKSPLKQRQTPSNNSKQKVIFSKPQLEVRIDESLDDQPFLPYNNNGLGSQSLGVNMSFEPPKVPNYTENEKQIKQKYHMLGKLRNFRNNSNLNLRRNSFRNAQMQMDHIYDIYRNTSATKNISMQKPQQKRNLRGEVFDKKRVSNPAPQQSDPRSVYGGLSLNFGPQVNSVKNININNLIQSHNIIQQEMMLQKSQENLQIQGNSVIVPQPFIAESNESPKLAASKIIEKKKLGSPYKLEKIYSNRQTLTAFTAQKSGQNLIFNRRATTIASSRSPQRSTSRPKTGRSVTKMSDEQQAQLGQIINFGVHANNYYEQRHFSIVSNAQSQKTLTPFNKNQSRLQMPIIPASGPQLSKSRNSIVKKSLNTFNVGPSFEQKRHSEYGKKTKLNQDKVSNQIQDALTSQLQNRSEQHLKFKIDQKKTSVSTINTDAKIQLNLSKHSKNLPKPSIKSLKSLQPTISTGSEFDLQQSASQEYGNIQQNHRKYKIIDPQSQKQITLKQNPVKINNQAKKQNIQIRQQVNKKVSNQSSQERANVEHNGPNALPQRPKFIRKQSFIRQNAQKGRNNDYEKNKNEQEMNEIDIKKIVQETIRASKEQGIEFQTGKQSSFHQIGSARKKETQALSVGVDTLNQSALQARLNSLEFQDNNDQPLEVQMQITCDHQPLLDTQKDEPQKFEEYKIPEIKVNPKRYRNFSSPKETPEPIQEQIPSQIEQIEKILNIEDEKLILKQSLEKINRTLQQTDDQLKRISVQKEQLMSSLDNELQKDEAQAKDLKTLQVNEDEDSELNLKQTTESKKEMTFVKLQDTGESNMLDLRVLSLNDVKKAEGSNVGSDSKQVTKELIKLDEVNRAVSFGVKNDLFPKFDGSNNKNSKDVNKSDEENIKMQYLLKQFVAQDVFEVNNYEIQIQASAEFQKLPIQNNSGIKNQALGSKKGSAVRVVEEQSNSQSMLQEEFEASPVVLKSKVGQYIQQQQDEEEKIMTGVTDEQQVYLTSPRIKEFVLPVPGEESLPGLRESRRNTNEALIQNMMQQEILKDDSILISDTHTNEEKKMNSVEKDYGIQDFYGAIENQQVIGNISLYEESFPQTDSVEDISQTIKQAQDIEDNGQDQCIQEDSLNGGQFQDVESCESLVNIGDQKHLDDLDALKIEQQGLKTTKMTMDLEQIRIQIIAEDYIEDLFRNVNSSLEFYKLDGIIGFQRYQNNSSGNEIRIQENNLDSFEGESVDDNQNQIRIQDNNLDDSFEEAKNTFVSSKSQQKSIDALRDTKDICLADLSHAEILTSKTPVNRGEQMILQINQNLGHQKMIFQKYKAQIVLTPQNVENAYKGQFQEQESSNTYSLEAQNKEQSVLIAQSSASSKKGQQYLEVPFSSSKYTDNFESLQQIQSGVNTQSLKAFQNINSCPKTDAVPSQKESTKSFTSVIEKSIIEEDFTSSESEQIPQIHIGQPTIVIPSSTPKNNEHQNTITPTGAASIQDFMDLHQSLCNYFKGTPMNASYIRLVIDLILDTKLGYKNHNLDDETIKQNKSIVDEELKDLQKKLWMFITCTKMMNQNLGDLHLKAAQESFRDDIDETCQRIYLILFPRETISQSQISEASSSQFSKKGETESIQDSKSPKSKSLNLEQSLQMRLQTGSNFKKPQASSWISDKNKSISEEYSDTRVNEVIKQTQNYLEQNDGKFDELENSEQTSSVAESELLAMKIGKECEEILEQRRQSNIKNIMVEQRKKYTPDMEIPGGDPNCERINKTQGMIRHIKEKYGL